MAIHDYSIEEFGHELHRHISPAKPINSIEMLHGREEQLKRIQRALFAEGRHIFIYGDRGVGKSSLAETAAAQYQSSDNDYIKVLCNRSSTFLGVIEEVVQRAVPHIPRTGGTTKIHGKLGVPDVIEAGIERTFADQAAEPITVRSMTEAVDQIARAAAAHSDSPIVVIDEFDTIPDRDERVLFADFLKQLGDRNVPIKFIFSGVASSLDALLTGHLSSIRQLETIELERLYWDARWDIVKDAAAAFGVVVDKNMLVRIAAISDGFPHYVHLVTEKLLWRMYDDEKGGDTATREHYVAALDDAINSISPHLREPYNKATQKDSMDYRDALWALADDYFLQRATGDIYNSYCRVKKVLGQDPITRPKFVQRLNVLKTERHACILQGLPNRKGWYEFRENMVRGYVRLIAESHGVELQSEAKIPKQVTAQPKAPAKRHTYQEPSIPKGVRFKGERKKENYHQRKGRR